jgi:Rrf2 family transcriptional regulator, iron-sulfur cluster assembly transcription factor
MFLTTKGRYAVMALVDIAVNSNGKPVTLADISTRQNIDLGYLEQIFTKLRKVGLVDSVRGPGGGYLLKRAKQEILVSDVMFAVEESFKMTRCEHKTGMGCLENKSRCITHHFWEKLEDHIYQFLKSMTISDVVDKHVKQEAPC